MHNYAFAPEGFDTEANFDLLFFVPIEAETWSATEEGSGYVMRDRTTGELTAYLPYGTTKLPVFNEDDVEGARLAALDIQSGAAFG